MIRGLAFSSGSYVGRTRIPVRMGYSTGSPAHGLGDLQSDAQAVVEAGITDQGTMDTLLLEGATDSQILALFNGTIDVPTLMNTLTAQPFAQQAGIQMQYEPTSWATYGVESALDDADSKLSQLENWAAASTAVRTDIGTQIVAARQQWAAWHTQYQNWVNQTEAPQELTLPDGTKVITDRVYQAGMNPYVIVTVVALGALVAAILAWKVPDALIARAKADMAATGTTQYQAYISKVPSGTVPQSPAQAGTTPGQTAQPPQPPGGLESWITANKSLVVGALLIVFVGPPLLHAVGSFGGRRR